MAYDKIIPIRSRLDHCVGYVLNPEKTGLETAMDYIGREDKNRTPDGRTVFETAINCQLDTAVEDMMETKRRWGKTGGVLGYHLIHSYAPGELTPEEAHGAGVEFARRLLGDRYEAVVSTHLDREHLHCHIVFNSVSFVDGTKYRNTFKDYFGDIRGLSNEVSEEHGLSVIDPEGGGRSYAEWNAKSRGKPTLRGLVRQDIDAAIAGAYTAKSFWQELSRMGYAVKRGPHVAHTAVRPPGGQRFLRLDSLGEGYTEADILARLAQGRTDPPQTLEPVRASLLSPGKKYFIQGPPPRRTRRLKGFRALYFKYLYLLGAVPSRRPVKRRAAVSRAEIIRFDRYQEQFRYLMKNRIEKADQLSMQYDAVQAEMDALAERRRELYKWRRAYPSESVDSEIDGITANLRRLRRELKMCTRIEADIPTVSAGVEAHSKEPTAKAKPTPQKSEIGR